jgi:phosphate transport system protein
MLPVVLVNQGKKMTKHFHNELEKLKKKILYLAARVEKNLQMAVKSFIDKDLTMADEVVNTDPDIDSLEVEVEEDCLKILALHQPVAADLRYIIAILKINNDLERIADYAVNIANRSKTITYNSGPLIPFDLQSMVEIAIKMVRDCVDSLVQNDAELARQVCIDDDEMDKRNRDVIKIAQDAIRANPDYTEYYVCLISVSKNLERIADHSTNIAEDVIYMIEGEIVRHRTEV